MSLRAVGQMILVEKDERRETMERGIIIPAGAERTPRFGPSVLATVRAIGGKVRELHVGDRIVLKAVAGDDLFWDGKKYTLLREKDIVGLAYE
jgi:co-chaperonin GroES (HSP10)